MTDVLPEVLLPDTQRGLYRKYEVRRTDGSTQHRDCAYFVLDVKHDPYAIPALRAYAEACRESHPNLCFNIEAALASEDPAEAIKKLF